MELIIIGRVSSIAAIAIVCALLNTMMFAKVSSFHCAALPTSAVYLGAVSMRVAADSPTAADAAAANAANAANAADASTADVSADDNPRRQRLCRQRRLCHQRSC